jgi:aminoglycoside 3-N-acetyltransferase
MLIAALSDAVGPTGTVLAYADWQGQDGELADAAVYADASIRPDIPPFDPLASRATRDNGAFPELLRTWPGARRSGNPGASIVALGGRAEWFTADHALDYGYGPHSPFGKLVEAQGKTLLLGAPLDTMTLLHHAEHLAEFPGKRIRRYEAPILIDRETVWRWFEEFDTSDPPDSLPDDYMATDVTDFLATGRGHEGKVREAPSVLVEAAEIVPFAVEWLEQRLCPQG